MTWNILLQYGLFFGVLLVLVKPLGGYMARVFEGERVWLDRVLGPVERLTYRVLRIDPTQEMDWKDYALAMLAFNAVGAFTLYALLRLQGVLPWNPERFPGMSWHLALNTAVSFVTNTNWQNYGGETTLSPLSQAAGLTVQNFVSAASGIAVLVALVRGLARRSGKTLGSFWVDTLRATLYVLLPLSLLIALVLVSQGVVQTLHTSVIAALLEPTRDEGGHLVLRQVLSMGPVASQEAIKELGTNGGGFFNTNSAHPFENPTPLSNLVEMLAILLIPASLTYTFGKMVSDRRQGWALLTVMFAIFVPMLWLAASSEQAGNPALSHLGVDQTATALSPGGNMEGKEVRFGIAGSALFTTVTTATSCGAVNAMHDSYTPLGGLVPMWLIELGEVVFGGVGSGLYGMLVFAILAVFVAGLMVGRTPEYLGKKIEAYDMKMVSLAILVPAAAILVGAAIGVATAGGRAGISNPGPHGFSEVLYAASSQVGNNGSAFAGLGGNTPFGNVLGAVLMFVGRFWIKVPVLALAGSLVAKKRIPPGAGTLPTHTPLFMAMVFSVIVIVGALTFFPALALGPIVEHLQMVAGR
ncbi:MAG: potassium-transporting ATPase subunit KdpA [Deltaproteobacteria bacterium]|nr:potassium-transporting ATPase subunit KdpA [Deltaproteobacteria bacterium]